MAEIVFFEFETSKNIKNTFAGQYSGLAANEDGTGKVNPADNFGFISQEKLEEVVSSRFGNLLVDDIKRLAINVDGKWYSAAEAIARWQGVE